MIKIHQKEYQDKYIVIIIQWRISSKDKKKKKKKKKTKKKKLKKKKKKKKKKIRSDAYYV